MAGKDSPARERLSLENVAAAFRLRRDAGHLTQAEACGYNLNTANTAPEPAVGYLNQ
jgi:hypothetical protein